MIFSIPSFESYRYLSGMPLEPVRIHISLLASKEPVPYGQSKIWLCIYLPHLLIGNIPHVRYVLPYQEVNQ